jgi:hypothetical protein
MSDRTSAAIFSEVFVLLASDPTDQHKQWAHALWPKTREYDFSDCQLGCDEALAKLDLADKSVNTEYPEDGKVWRYGLPGEREF